MYSLHPISLSTRLFMVWLTCSRHSFFLPDHNFYEGKKKRNSRFFIGTSNFHLSMVFLDHSSILRLKWCLAGALLELMVNVFFCIGQLISPTIQYIPWSKWWLWCYDRIIFWTIRSESSWKVVNFNSKIAHESDVRLGWCLGGVYILAKFEAFGAYKEKRV